MHICHLQVDSWAVGVLAYELVTGRPPFEQDSRSATYEHIMYRDPRFPAYVSQEARSFVCLALCKVRLTHLMIVLAGTCSWLGQSSEQRGSGILSCFAVQAQRMSWSAVCYFAVIHGTIVSG